MKKIFSSKGMNSKKKKGKKYKKQDNNALDKEAINPIYFNSNDAYNFLESWSDYANLKITDFPDILATTNIINFPISIYDYDKASCKILCKDVNGVCFSIDYNYASSKLILSIEFENEVFDYALNHKISSNDLPHLTLVSHTKNCEYKEYKLNFDRKLNKIKQTLTIEDTLYMIEINLLSENHSQTDIVEKILNIEGLKKTFDNLENLTSSSMLTNLISNLELTEQDLNSLEINITFLFKKAIFSKVKLFKNTVTQLIFTTEAGYYDLSNDGKLFFTSSDSYFTITINNILNLDKTSKCVNYINEIINYANTMLEKMNNNNLS